MQIKFYKTREEHGYLSNFWKKDPFTFEGHLVQTSEALYQALKFNKSNPLLAVKILTHGNPGELASWGRDPANTLRSDWEQIKDDAMRIAIMYKFQEGASFYEKFLSTDGQELIEDSPIDYYWGCGKDGKGKNMLGKLLMEHRDFINNHFKSGGSTTALGFECRSRFIKLLHPFAGEDGRIFMPNFAKPFDKRFYR